MIYNVRYNTAHDRKEILNYLNSTVRKEDIIFTLNHYGVFKLRKLIKTVNPKIIVDIHGLQSIEIK